MLKEHNSELFPPKEPLSGYQTAQAGLALILKEHETLRKKSIRSGNENIKLFKIDSVLNH